MGNCAVKKNAPKTVSPIVPLIKSQTNPFLRNRAASLTSLGGLFEEEMQLSPAAQQKARKKRGSYQKGNTMAPTEASNAIIKDVPKTTQDKKEIRAALGRHFIFQSLSEDNIEAVISHMKLYVLEPQQVIYSRGGAATHFFTISKGRCEVVEKGIQKGVLGKGSSFGEMALMQECERTSTVRSIDKVMLWGIDRHSFRNAIESINAQRYNENKQFIESVPLLQNLNKGQQEALLAVLTHQEFEPGRRVVTEGDPGSLFYIIKDGLVNCTIKGKLIRQMSRGDYFGEQALLYNSLRTATITVVTKATLLSLGRDDLTRALGNQLQKIIYKNSQRIALEASPVLKNLTKAQEEDIVSKMKCKSFETNDVVIPRGTPRGQKLWIVVKGNLITEQSRKRFNALSCIGDIELGAPPEGVYEENLRADGNVDIEEMSRQEFESCIGGQLSRVSSRNEILSIMRNVQLLKALPFKKLESLVNKVYIREFRNQEVIFYENAPGDAFYIVKEGKVDIVKNNAVIRTIGQHDYFGERSIILKEKRTATVRANGPVHVWVLSKEDFLSLVNEGIRIMLLKRIELQDDKITLKDLHIVKLLGKGMFGNVFLAVHKVTRLPYAIKTISRDKIRAYDLYSSLLLERHILLQTDHPLIMKLVKTFKDHERIYFLQEYVQGKDLFDVLREIGIMNDANAKFYISCILTILEHMHERDIIYRDLKPENIVIDEEGYPKLIDFGTAKVVQGRTYTIVGTPHYMAPEVITGKGYGVSADYWCLGVMAYEFICGIVPFGDSDEEPYKIYEKILQNRLAFPQKINKSLKTIKIIEVLLDKDPAPRSSTEIIKGHNYFNSVNWDSILSKQIKAPYIPGIPSIANEIFQAMRNKQTLTAFISQEEARDSLEVPKRGKPPEPGWDDPF
ncbi:PKG_3 [Blepharisma stoltei]|uniref:cGMP-dependent protein kinase n=1 Tax=Blepharisma stoltei TaxID=1481888 RepID=A0AAU9JCE5_9CILI|nr:unnamed protein product [Blepharisma stoltei]